MQINAHKKEKKEKKETSLVPFLLMASTLLVICLFLCN